MLLLQKNFNENSTGGGKIALVDGKMNVSERVLAAAEKLAADAADSGTAISKNPQMEFLLWLGKTTHVKNAIEGTGAKQGGEFVAVLLGGAKAEFAGVKKHFGARETGRLPKTSEKDLAQIEGMAICRISE